MGCFDILEANGKQRAGEEGRKSRNSYLKRGSNSASHTHQTR
jgi:hypothetical protein